MTRPEHLREHLRTPSGQKHLRTDDSPTPEHRTAGQRTYGSTYGTYAPEHLRPPPFLDEGVACSATSMTPRSPTPPRARPEGWGVTCAGAVDRPTRGTAPDTAYGFPSSAPGA